jgi:hypothetical protein
MFMEGGSYHTVVAAEAARFSAPLYQIRRCIGVSKRKRDIVVVASTRLAGSHNVTVASQPYAKALPALFTYESALHI